MIGWKLVREQDGITVQRKLIGGDGVATISRSPVADLSSFRYACVKAEGVLRASPKQILQLFEDNTRYPLAYYRQVRHLQ